MDILLKGVKYYIVLDIILFDVVSLDSVEFVQVCPYGLFYFSY